VKFGGGDVERSRADRSDEQRQHRDGDGTEQCEARDVRAGVGCECSPRSQEWARRLALSRFFREETNPYCVVSRLHEAEEKQEPMPPRPSAPTGHGVGDLRERKRAVAKRRMNWKLVEYPKEDRHGTGR